MGLAYFMLQSLRNVRFRRGKKIQKEVCTLCGTNNFMKEKYPVLFMEWCFFHGIVGMFCCCSSEL